MRPPIRRRTGCVLFKFHFTNCTTRVHLRANALLAAHVLHFEYVYQTTRQEQRRGGRGRVSAGYAVGKARGKYWKPRTSRPVGPGHFSLLCVSFVRVTSYACTRVPHVGVRARARAPPLLKKEETVTLCTAQYSIS